MAAGWIWTQPAVGATEVGSSASLMGSAAFANLAG